MEVADKKYKKDNFFMIIQILCVYPIVAVFFLPRDFNPVWWNILVVISFISCVVFCAFGNSFILKAQKKSFTPKLNLFNKTILFYNLPILILASILILLLIEEKSVLSAANTLALLSGMIWCFRIFRIDILKNSVKDK